jgi:hypothetical protein
MGKSVFLHKSIIYPRTLLIVPFTKTDTKVSSQK